MRGRRILVVAGLLALLLAATVGMLWFAFALSAGPVTPATAGRIKPGMTLAEVEALLGVSGNRHAAAARVWIVFAEPHKLLWSFTTHGVAYEADLIDAELPGDASRSGDPDSPVQFWGGRDGAIQVRLDADRRVIDARFLPGRVSPLYQPDMASYLKRLWLEHFVAETPRDVP